MIIHSIIDFLEGFYSVCKISSKLNIVIFDSSHKDQDIIEAHRIARFCLFQDLEFHLNFINVENVDIFLRRRISAKISFENNEDLFLLCLIEDRLCFTSKLKMIYSTF